MGRSRSICGLWSFKKIPKISRTATKYIQNRHHILTKSAPNTHRIPTGYLPNPHRIITTSSPHLYQILTKYSPHPHHRGQQFTTHHSNFGGTSSPSLKLCHFAIFNFLRSCEEYEVDLGNSAVPKAATRASEMVWGSRLKGGYPPI